MYGNRKVTVENAMQVFNPNSKAYQDVMQVAGGDQNLFNLLANNIVYQAKNKGKPLTNMKNAKSVMDKTMGLPSDDPTRATFKLNQSEANVLGVTGKGQVQGYSAAMNLTADVNNGFAKLGEILPGVVDNLARLKGFLDTLPQAGAGGATLSGGLGSAANHLMGVGETMLELQGLKSASGLLGKGMGRMPFLRGLGGRAAATTAVEAGAGGTEALVGGSALLAMRKKLASGAKGLFRKLVGGGGRRVAMAGAEEAVGAEAATAGLGSTALAAAGRILPGVGIAMGTNWAVPKLREWGAKHGIKAHSFLDDLGTTAAYAGGYAAAGATIAGPAGAIAGTIAGIGRGLWYSFAEGGDSGPPSGLMSILSKAGFKGHALDVAGAFAMAESGGHANSHNTNASTGDNSYGLFQINMLGDMGPARRKQYHLKSNNDLLDPLTNAKVAYKMSHEGKLWGPWSTYKSGAYKKYLRHGAGADKDLNASGSSAKNAVTGQHGGAGGGLTAPADGPITADYGQKPKDNSYWRWKGYHTGRDYGVKDGSTVKAYKDGVVKYVGPGQNLRGAGEPYGNIVVVEHGGHQSMYAHLNRGTVKAGQIVKAGQQIGLSGHSGSGAKAGPHLHFEVRKGKFPNANETDPRPYLMGAKGGGKSFLDTVAGDVTHAVDSVTHGIGSLLSGVEKAIASGWHIAWGALTGKSNGGGSAGAAGSAVSSGVPGGIDQPLSSMIGGDTGIPGGSGLGSSGMGTVVNMTVHVHGSSVQDARRFAKEVQSVLAAEDRTVRIGKY
jgi:murein DD-endopeptidase MepM/ murein hydrolase activator NlpD